MSEVRRPVVVASNVLLNDRDEILMGLRSDNLLWEVPGGKIEAESVVDGGRREQKEETGMDLLGRPLFLGYSDSWDYLGRQGRPWHVCMFLLWSGWEGFPQLVEGKHLQWRWFKLDELPPPEKLSYGTKVFVSELLPHYLKTRPAVPAGYRPPGGDQVVVFDATEDEGGRCA